MLLAASGLMRRKEASGAEVVCTLLAPNDRIWNTTLAALHLHKATILPKELILSSVLKMLAETPDHWMHNLHAIRWQVHIETRILLHDDLPFGSQRVAQRKQAVPVQVRIRPNSQLCRHVFDHLWGNFGTASCCLECHGSAGRPAWRSSPST